MGLQRKIFLLFFLLLFCIAVQAQTVYITKTGTKYHEETCRYLSKSKISVELTKAKEGGYTACSVCSGGTVIPRQKASMSQQCSGTTKAGNRCKRMTTSANGRCYQH
jgi:hypothetical protein